MQACLQVFLNFNNSNPLKSKSYMPDFITMAGEIIGISHEEGITNDQLGRLKMHASKSIQII